MQVWIVCPYGPIPGEGWREFRCTMAARALEADGHQVVWWTSVFEHRSKQFRNTTWEDRRVTGNFTVRLVPTTGYTSHVGLARIRSEQTFARNVKSRALGEQAPDVIVLSEPALFTSKHILEYARRRNVPVMVDIGDLWPELFDILLPKPIRALGRIVFSPLYRRRRKLLEQVRGYVAVTKDYLAIMQATVRQANAEVAYWGVDVAGVQASIQAPGPTPPLGEARGGKAEVFAIYAGTLGDNYDIRSMLRAAELLLEAAVPVRLVIAGAGPLESFVRTTIEMRKLTNVTYLGSLPADVLARLYAKCDIALSTYVEASPVAMPIKAFDYLAAGLPMVNSLRRDLGEIVLEQDVGVQYEPENPASLAAGIRRLVEDPSMRARQRANALRLAPAFDWRLQYAHYVAVVRRAVPTRG
jgi:glycosyltransferase involved in cell wall biosynthesis